MQVIRRRGGVRDEVEIIIACHFMSDLMEQMEQDAANEDDDDVNIGIEHVNKVEVYYCDLCRYYLPPRDDVEVRIKWHCQSRAHLRAYLQFKDDELLRQDAERLAKKRSDAKKAAAEKKVAAATPAATDGEKEKENGQVEEAGVETKADAAVKTEEGQKGTTGENGTKEDALDLANVDAKDFEAVVDEDQDVSDILEVANYEEEDEDSRINSERWDQVGGEAELRKFITISFTDTIVSGTVAMGLMLPTRKWRRTPIRPLQRPRKRTRQPNLMLSPEQQTSH